MTTPTPLFRAVRARRSGVALGAALLVLAAGTAVSPLTAIAAAADDLPATSPTEPAGPDASGLARDASAFEAGRYIVTLRDEAVATYAGGTGSFAATRARDGGDLDARSKRAVAYADHLADEQTAVADSVGAEIISSYTLATNGFSSTLTAEQAAALDADPRVVEVVKDELLHVQEAVPSTEFLGLSGDGGVWDATGGFASAGEGVVVGVIDTGIAPENPSFAGEPLGDTAGADPYRDGDEIVFDKSDGGTFRGVCETGEQFAADDCSTKLIGARYFLDNFGEGQIGPDRAEYVSPRDGNSHGSHTASTAAGNHGVHASVAGRDLGEISGVAPAAKIAAYKVCWSGLTHLEDGCAMGDLLAAIDAAVADGVDVINFSIGGGSAYSTVSLTDQAFLRAAAAGIFVAAAAGNAGPEASTADNAAPWITTVAASTIPSYDATVRLGDGRALLGGSITLPAAGTLAGPLVAASAIAVGGAESPTLCGPDTLDPAGAAGKIVLCERGVFDRVAKSAEVARAGGIAMVLVNPSPNSIDLDTHSVPTVHLDADSFEAVTAYAATDGATVTLEDGNTTGGPTFPTPQVAGFSSRGPILADGGDILKPDVAAPGVAILADGANAEGEDPTFMLMSGTSMASPHIAGLAALYLGERPNASPAAIKSALMTTAYDTVDASGSPVSDPFAQGAGHTDPRRYLEPGLLFLNDLDDWLGYVQGLGAADFGVAPIDPSSLNLASISIGALAGVESVERTVTSTAAGRFEAQAVDMPGVDVTVEPSVLEFGGAGEEATYTVTFRRTDAALEEFTTGALRWVGGGSGGGAGGTVTTPLAVRPVLLSVPSRATGEGVDGSVDIPVSAGATTDVPIAIDGLVEGRVMHGVGTAGGTRDRHLIEVPEGTTYARFELDAADDSADLDLRLYSSDGAGGGWLMREATTPSADETLIVPEMGSSRYVLEVDFFSGEGDLAYDLTAYLVGGDPSVGGFTADPSVLSMRLGEPASVTASWSGLEPGSRYFGRVHVGTGFDTTNVFVTTPGEPTPPDDEEFTLSVAPERVRPGKGFVVEAAGLDPAEPFTVTLDGEPFARGIAGDDGRAGQNPIMPADTAAGVHVVGIDAESGHAEASIEVADFLVVDTYEYVEYLADGTASAAAEVQFSGNGTARVVIESAGGSIALDERLELSHDPMFDFDVRRSSAARVTAGDYTIHVWAVAVDGSLSQQIDHPFTVEETKPSTVTMTANAADPNLVDIVYDNQVGAITQATVRYKMCSGPVVFATIWIDKPVISGTYDMTAMTGVDFLIDGEVLASYANTGSARCADAPKITNDFWAILSDGTLSPEIVGDAQLPDASRSPSIAGLAPTAGLLDFTSGEPASDAMLAAEPDPEHPVTLTHFNRYPAYSSGYDFSVGYGSSIYSGQFYWEGVPHDRVLEPGPVMARTIQVEEGEPFWVRAKYEVITPDKQISAHRLILTTAVTLAELAPVTDPVDPGTPGGPGGPGGPGQGGPVGGGSNSPAAGGGPLAFTGVEAGGLIAIAALILALGGVAVTAGMRRRRRDGRS
ncbi:S8 family peptidase [Agromyces protaetiae]|uniref:S8 family peptidase n=1 Tax=Agromyces protaetiae TaxID=2509455 RepID=UPI001AA08656|nr:S8 family peptidase [Agromyces protaetiae]